ncbi:MAG TPA: enoyl-CoA hydratase/isomerase family protein [Actinomycetota bacterium]|nr:enoyl-CoA hydratase/isomerase family protein [Actinomycetota bacterium]
MGEPVSISHDGDLAVVTIDRPERRNAIDAATATALAAALAEAGASARVVIVTGAGDAFCAGGDLEELEAWTAKTPEDIAATLYGSFQQMIRTLRSSDAVFVAAINGAAVGAGLDLALACDLRVAAETARLGQVWVRLGVIPGTGGAYLTQHLAGPTKAAELLLTGDLITAEEARAANLVNEVVPAGDLSAAARALAQRILRHPRGGVVANKRAYIAATDAALETALTHAAEVQGERFTSDEFKTAIRAARSR